MNFNDMMIKLIAIFMAIRGYAKDIHYSVSGKTMYGEHIFADVIEENPDNDILDEMKEVFFLGRNYSVPDSVLLTKESVKYYPPKSSDDNSNWLQLRNLIAKAMFIIEQSSPMLTIGEANLIGGIAQELQKNLGLLNLRLGFPLLEEEDLSDVFSIANNDRWITVKPHGDEEKGRHLKLEGDETPKEAMKRQWGVDLDKKKDKSSSGSDKPQKDDKKSSDSLKKSQDIKKEIDSLKKELDSLDTQKTKAYEKKAEIYKELKEKSPIKEYTFEQDFRLYDEASEKAGLNKILEREREINKEILEKEKQYRFSIADKYIYPEKIANVEKGPKMSQEKANGGSVNPKYSERGGYTINCQSCVVCYEARLRGYDVSTKPNTRGSKLDKLSRQTYAAWINPENGEFAQSIDPDETVNNYKKYYQFLKETLKDNERYNLSFNWKGRSRSGHIVSMYKENGDLVLYDPQNGKKYKNEQMANEYLSRIKFGVKSYGLSFNLVPKLYRVDNMAFNPDYVNDIMEAANGR